ncbi:unnamed protein product [Citrullus colocynthis]|uniref:RNase H type-1 domain-containing protein n=1 Tax=Citrullus colocynthis TaxID=252529 RepID=A0ABP0YB41_9ROSI
MKNQIAPPSVHERGFNNSIRDQMVSNNRKSLPASTGIGIVLRDSGAACRDTVSESSLVEKRAIVEGLKFASSRNCPNLIVESDSLQSINLLNEEDPELRSGLKKFCA